MGSDLTKYLVTFHIFATQYTVNLLAFREDSFIESVPVLGVHKDSNVMRHIT